MTADDARPAGGPATPDPTPGAPAGPDPAPGGPASPDPASGPAGRTGVPDAETLAAMATPATVRRAPKIAPFIATGALLGAVVAWLLVLLSSGTTGGARTLVVLVVTAGGAIVGALVGAGLATVADRRSARRGGRR